ncbi:hypothetical protein BS47DRAFT_1363108 [Hydnum rufescens UP504]|uniref:Uncharacterized protein n=1 Tax=Hydnum rufescens UP504 TaxID=1448309 RepID=A0A9P6AWB4_9AGAM|nr:hypothetical protein BS47DRAFT_1363108 [Hydnum rufescens UP504]
MAPPLRPRLVLGMPGGTDIKVANEDPLTAYIPQPLSPPPTVPIIPPPPISPNPTTIMKKHKISGIKVESLPSPKCAKCQSDIIDCWDEVSCHDEVTAKVQIDAATEVKLVKIAAKAKDHQEVREQKECCDLHKLEVEREKLKMKMQLEMMRMQMQMSKGGWQMFSPGSGTSPFGPDTFGGSSSSFSFPGSPSSEGPSLNSPYSVPDTLDTIPSFENGFSDM